jgi:RNA polymerase sigma factor (sigma-70 family)
VGALLPDEYRDRGGVRTADNPEEHVCRQKMLRQLERAITKLSYQEQRAIVGTYLEEKNLLDVGAEMGLSESRVCQVRQAAIRKLRTLFSNQN